MDRKPRFATLLVAVALVFSCAALFAEADPMAQKAADFISLLQKGDFQTAYGKLDSNLGFKLNVEKLSSVWRGLTEKAGGFVEFRESKIETVQTYTVVTHVCKFEKGLVDLKVALDTSGRVADFRYTNHAK